jgi:predicted PhzF superfamily epimerase YddE/YHI9
VVSDSIEVNVARVFTTDTGELGNKLGIVWASDATRGREQELAARIGFSETVFIESVLGGHATISIYTPATELPFAGHPSVGTAWWLGQQGMPVSTLNERAGDVAVRYDGDRTWITGRAEWTPSFIWRPLATTADVDALDPDAVVDGSEYAYAWIDQSAGELRSRMFAPHLGVREDEATGAAAVALTARLAQNLDITQGLGSRIHTTLLADGLVEVGGRTVADEPFMV